ncbi:MAG: hypothetical protein LBR56_07660, partial [Sporomusaceae bacterium]|nr:hypothetical protein [Sporomusaceae bacterium]
FCWGKKTFCKKFSSPKPPSFKNFWQGGLVVHPGKKQRKEGINSFFSQVLQQFTSKFFSPFQTAKIF